jgi:hypothetical protein
VGKPNNRVPAAFVFYGQEKFKAPLSKATRSANTSVCNPTFDGRSEAETQARKETKSTTKAQLKDQERNIGKKVNYFEARLLFLR